VIGAKVLSRIPAVVVQQAAEDFHPLVHAGRHRRLTGRGRSNAPCVVLPQGGLPPNKIRNLPLTESLSKPEIISSGRLIE